MNLELHFAQIKEQIIKVINSSQTEIRAAVAWLTDEDIMRILTQKAKDNVDVTIAISNSKENFRDLSRFRSFLLAGGRLFVSQEAFLHHKFCLVDRKTLINGSYNWSYSAQHNEENIMVITLDDTLEQDEKLLKKVDAKFKYLCEKVSKSVVDYPSLLSYASAAVNQSTALVIADENEMILRKSFEDHVQRSIQTSKDEGIQSNYDRLLERMKTDGGGVYFVRRILREEMLKNEMKSGFNKLVERIPYRVDLSLEYLVCQPQYATLFRKDEIEFCRALMKKYNLAV